MWFAQFRGAGRRKPPHDFSPDNRLERNPVRRRLISSGCITCTLNRRRSGLSDALPDRCAGAASIAAAGVAAAQLWELRTGRVQDVQVSVRAAAAALRSSRYMKLEEPAQADPLDPLTGFYPLAGGRWVYLHCNFPNHRDSALAVLGISSAVRDDLAAAVARWDGPSLEDALMNSGGCAALTRSEQEWLQHPQAAAVHSLPLLEIVRIGEPPAQPLPGGPKALGLQAGSNPRPLSSLRHNG
jgi:crotonobetainyl-CoA:carnitine CoA-transferase CaiB-like acyl-CoA transferase